MACIRYAYGLPIGNHREAMTYWQIAAGSFGRDYTDRFIRHGLAFVGGDWQCQSMAQVKSGDVVILKRGRYLVVAVGIVVEREGVIQACDGKNWLLDFDGWELPAWCNVDWHVPPKPVETTGLTRATIQGVNKQHLLDVANQVLREIPKCTEYEAEPAATEQVPEEEIIGELIRFGLRPGAAEELTQALRRIRLLAKFYLSRDNALTKEHETRTFLVVPLLQALGWPEQRIQIEYAVQGVGRADIACFREPVLKAVNYEDQENGITLLIETKGLEQGLDYAPDQAKGYASKFPSCNVVLVTNGYCYKAYKRDDNAGEFADYPSAYLNIMTPSHRYPLDPERVAGAIEVLKMLIPR